MQKQQWLAPQTVPGATISGRAVEPLTLTLPSRTKYPKQKIGFGIKSTHRFAPDSPYTFIGFDFSGEEMSVASMFAQSRHGGESGTDAFDKAVLKGIKEEGTDLHSLTGKAAGISRTIAKGVIYAQLYGSGLKTTTNTVKQGLTESEKSQADAFARSATAAFKGVKNQSTQQYEGGVASNYFNYVYHESAKSHNNLIIFDQPVPKCLSSFHTGRSGSPSQINIQIQAACSTYGMLSAYLIFLFNELESEGLTDWRFSCAIHDEVIMICRKEDTELFAKCMVRAHAAVWALLSTKLGISDLPVSRLIYDIVIDVSSCLRKESCQKIDTPDFKYSELGYQYYVNRKNGKLTKRTFNHD